MLERFMNFLHSNVALFGGIGGAVITLVFLETRNFITRPRLSLSFDGDDEAYMTSSTHREHDQQVTRKYIRVCLRTFGCLGSSAATNCRIYITAIQCDGTEYLHDARIISWPPNKDFDPRDIPRGISMFANIVTMKKGDLGWNFQIPNPYGLHSVRLHPGTLLLRITATADNAKPKSIAIEASIKADLSGFQARRR
jgi:hypothetical protein